MTGMEIMMGIGTAASVVSGVAGAYGSMKAGQQQQQYYNAAAAKALEEGKTAALLEERRGQEELVAAAYAARDKDRQIKALQSDVMASMGKSNLIDYKMMKDIAKRGLEQKTIILASGENQKKVRDWNAQNLRSGAASSAGMFKIEGKSAYTAGLYGGLTRLAQPFVDIGSMYGSMGGGGTGQFSSAGGL